jgi:hypothetical protein
LSPTRRKRDIGAAVANGDRNVSLIWCGNDQVARSGSGRG